MSSPTRFPYPRPSVRPLKIYAFDPMVARDTRTKITVEPRNEPLGPGPYGSRIAVIDYDATRRCFYTPVHLDDPGILMQSGIDHSEGDPRFHQQMVYAVASQILGIFDRALGRPFNPVPHGRRPLRIFPHAFEGQNAYYHPEMGALLFGYFRADREGCRRQYSWTARLLLSVARRSGARAHACSDQPPESGTAAWGQSRRLRAARRAVRSGADAPPIFVRVRAS